MKQLFKYILSFVLGAIVASFVSYNMLYGSLLYSQLHSSILFYERLDQNNKEELKNNLVNVLIPIELCRANNLINSPLFIKQEYLNSEVEKAFNILGISDTSRDSYCSSRI
ncbi:hypothetical protein [Pseudoalteromonas sp. MMG024]|uniref:hypothetical protein n=1 Tax=Pseudoalteromonas sp. MMG024 TaxID=2909980 RepID=UPI001F17E8E0|nr:hypothetical protein [Pseudoalteromonas sp. MMG024]MCF6459398.1 hypothetical protein [Pseudoalteromonas sp. MMG024]